MNRKALLIGLPVALLPEDTDYDSVIGRSDSQTEAESGKSASKLPDACSANSLENGDSSKVDTSRSGSKAPEDGTEPEAGIFEATENGRERPATPKVQKKKWMKLLPNS